MLTCKKCNLTITGSLTRCPLCQGDLTGEAEPDQAVFPVVPPARHPHRVLLRLMMLASIAAAAICAAINLSLPEDGWWCLFVVGGLASFWLSFAILLKKRHNIPKGILWQVALISALAIGWDLCTGFYGWSLDYVVPILCICAMIAMAVISKIIKLRIEDYILYLILDIVFGIVPLILILCHVLDIVYPSAACVAASLVSLAALFLFEGQALRSEIARRMHL